jgi:hypothetical protein
LAASTASPRRPRRRVASPAVEPASAARLESRAWLLPRLRCAQAALPMSLRERHRCHRRPLRPLADRRRAQSTDQSHRSRLARCSRPSRRAAGGIPAVAAISRARINRWRSIFSAFTARSSAPGGSIRATAP